MYPQPIPISALQHYIFCTRHCALIYVEGLWAENRLTVEGHVLHKKPHAEKLGPRGGGRAQTRPGVRTVRALSLCSDRLGLVGKADVVEFHDPDHLPNASTPDPNLTPSIDQSPHSSSVLNSLYDAAMATPSTQPRTPRPKLSRARFTLAFPVEYKRGKPKRHDADLVQLCAQALCLEEMLSLSDEAIPAGALYYGITKLRPSFRQPRTHGIVRP